MREFVGHVSVVVLGQGAVAMRGLIVLPIVIKSVGAETYGAYALVSGALMFVLALSSMGTSYRPHRLLPSTRERRGRAKLLYPTFVFQLAATATLSCGYLLFLEMLSWLDVQAPGHSGAAGVVFFFSYFLYSQSVDYFRFTGRIQFSTLAQVGFAYLFVALVIALSLMARVSVTTLVLAQAGAAALVAVPTGWIVVREIGVTPAFYSLAGLWRDIRLGFPLRLGTIVDFVLSSSDRYLIAIFLGVGAVGNYVPAYVIGSLILFAPRALTTVLAPLMSRAVSDEQGEGARELLRYSLRCFVLIALPFVAGCALLGGKVLGVLTSEEVAAAGTPVLVLVAAGTALHGFAQLYSNIFFVQFKTGIMFRAHALAAGINLITNAIFLTVYPSIVVAGWSTFLSYGIGLAYVLRSLPPDWRGLVNWRTVRRSVASVGVMCVGLLILGWGTDLGGFGGVGVEVVAGVGLYATSLMALGEFSISKRPRFIA